MKPFREAVLLVDDQTQTFRIVTLEKPYIVFILERVHVGRHETKREWTYRGERDEKGNRIFRERPPTRREDPERPMYDELDVKLPGVPPGTSS